MEETTPKTNKTENKERANNFTGSGGTLSHIRTYAADMKRAIDSRGATLASISNTEQTAEKKRPKAVPGSINPQRTRTMLFLFGALALFILGAVLVGTTYFLTRSSENQIELPKSIIFANKTNSVDITDVTLDKALAQLRQDEALTLGEIEHIILTNNGVPLAASDVAEALGLPAGVSREVTDAMVGLHSFNRNQPFVILEVAAYDRSFNALLEGEKNLGRNLGNFFAPVDEVTSGNAQNVAPNLVFQDLIVRNADVRVSQSEWPILYTYPTRTLLIITTNDFTLREITTRYSNTIR